MAKELKVSEGEKEGFYTSIYDSDTGKSCATEKIVDITEDCPKASKKKRAILLFTRAKKGRIVQIRTTHKGQASLGSNIHYFVEVLDREMNAVGWNTFDGWASELGLTNVQLRTLIETHTPAA